MNGKEVKDILKTKGVKITDLAKNLGISQPNLSALLKNDKEVAEKWLVKIENSLGFALEPTTKTFTTVVEPDDDLVANLKSEILYLKSMCAKYKRKYENTSYILDHMTEIIRDKDICETTPDDEDVYFYDEDGIVMHE